MYQLRVFDADLKNKSSLAWHVLIKLLWLSVVSIFLPVILIREFWFSLREVFLFEMFHSFCIIFFSYHRSLPSVAKHGTVTTMLTGVLFLVVNFIVLYCAKIIPAIIILSPIFSAAYIAYFRLGYHVAMLDGVDARHHIGQQNARIESAWILAGLLWPLLWWYVADIFWASTLFIFVIVCLLFSAIPLMYKGKKHDFYVFKPSFQYITAWLPKIAVKDLFVSFAALSYIGVVGTTIWSLLLFSFLGTYSKLAVISSWSSILLLVFLWILGKKSDENDRKSRLDTMMHRSFRWQWWTWIIAWMSVLLWFIVQFLYVFVDTFHKISYKVNETYIMNHFYEQIGQKSDKIFSLHVLFMREVALHTWKSLLCLLLIFLFSVFWEQYRLLILPFFFVVFMVPLALRSVIYKKNS